MFVGTINGYSQDKDVVTATVEFVVNTNNFIKNRDYERFINELVPYVKDNARNIESVTLIGSASPEGNSQHNIYLANIRSEKIYSYIKEYVPKSKIVVNNDYDLFLNKTGVDESDYNGLRATYIELHFNKPVREKETVIDTVYIEKRDTIYKETINNYYYTQIEHKYCKPVLSVYNDLFGDLLFRANIGAEVYFHQMSFFVEGSFSNWKLVGKTYNIDIWHIGLRKYFNNEYDKLFIEVNANAGYFDTDLFNPGKVGVLYGGGIGCGYVFNLGKHWKISPILRIGLYEKIYYVDYKTVEGNMNVSFGSYINGKTDDTGNTLPDGNVQNEVVSKAITSEFFNKSNKAYYIGPTYIGVFLKRDFCLNKKKKIQKD